MRNLIALALVAAVGGAAEARHVRFHGAHPISVKHGGGYCYIEAPHFHAYAPEHAVMYQQDGDGFVFVGVLPPEVVAESPRVVIEAPLPPAPGVVVEAPEPPGVIIQAPPPPRVEVRVGLPPPPSVEVSLPPPPRVEIRAPLPPPIFVPPPPRVVVRAPAPPSVRVTAPGVWVGGGDRERGDDDGDREHREHHDNGWHGEKEHHDNGKHKGWR